MGERESEQPQRATHVLLRDSLMSTCALAHTPFSPERSVVWAGIAESVVVHRLERIHPAGREPREERRLARRRGVANGENGVERVWEKGEL